MCSKFVVPENSKYLLFTVELRLKSFVILIYNFYN